MTVGWFWLALKKCKRLSEIAQIGNKDEKPAKIF